MNELLLAHSNVSGKEKVVGLSLISIQVTEPIERAHCVVNRVT